MSYTLDLSNLVQSVAANISHLVTHGLAQPIFDLKHSGGMLLYVLLALAVGFVFGRWCTGLVRHRFAFQNHGEATVSGAVLADFNSPKYHLMNHVTLRMPDGTTQVDHILVSTFGVFVIETKNYSGWIFADATQANWTQVFFSARFKFQNPIFQNYRHVIAVRNLLDFLPVNLIKSAVVFTGDGQFKTEIPEGVFDVSGFIAYLHNQTVEVMSQNRMQFCVGRIETARLAITGQTDVDHVQSLERRYGRET
ncbi:MAG: hypothetical protein RLZZ126_134 [Pseudomonadota bacterium]|jgi:hypothetical protein